MEKHKTYFISLIIFISGCAISERPEPGFIYEKDLEMIVNGEAFTGVGIPKDSIEYEIEVESRGKNDYIQFKSCGRFRKFEGRGSKVKFNYIPMDQIENDGLCVLDIASLDIKQRHGWGRLAFRNKKYNLNAFLRCNGFEGLINGTSICDVLFGLDAQIKFSKPVLTRINGECVIPPASDRMTFNFKAQKGDCVYEFKEIGASNWHVLFVSGWERSYYKGDN